jgi:ATP-dependent protease ClpP protease subunit
MRNDMRRLLLTLTLLAPLTELQASSKLKAEVGQEVPGRALTLQGEVTAGKLAALALRLSTNEPMIHIYIDSPGGDYNAAKRFVKQLEKHRLKGRRITCYGGPLVASAAYYIYIHCDNRYALPSSLLFPHKIHVLFYQPVPPLVLLQEGYSIMKEQAEWDGYARNITGMTEEDYLAFRDSDDSLWPLKKVQEKSKNKWFDVVDYYLLKIAD